MKNTVNNILEQFFGLKLIPSKKLKPIVKKIDNNLVVEFVGPSCIGKTTLRDYYLDNYQYDFKRKVYKTLPIYSNKIEFTKNDQYNAYLNVMFNDIAKQNINGILKFNSIKRIYKYLCDDFVINNYYQNSIFIFDEHLFSRIYENILSHQELRKFTRNRIIISCTSSTNNLIKNIQERRHNNINYPSNYTNLEGNALKEEVNRVLLRKKRQFQLLKEIGTNIIEINTDNSLAENCKIIDTYITNIKNTTI